MMSISKEMAVRKRQTDLPLTKFSAHGVAKIGGLGSRLDETYTYTGNLVDSGINKISHNLGCSVIAITRRIEAIFEGTEIGGSKRERRLYDLYCAQPSSSTGPPEIEKLERNCGTLIGCTRRYVEITLNQIQPLQNYVRSNTYTIRLQAFKSMLMLMTRYPGLRRLFLAKHKEAVQSLINIPQAPFEHLGEEWKFWHRIVVACFTDRSIVAELEQKPPEELGLLVTADDAPKSVL